MKNKITDLRNHLFETLEDLRDKDKPMEVERARAISNVAQTIINSAKIELQAFDLLGIERKPEFFDQPRLAQAQQPLLPGSVA